MRKSNLVFIFIFVFLAHALTQACSSPSGVAGQLKWVTSENKIKWCNGSSWTDASTSTGASCLGVASGTIRYSASVMQYCNGSNWMSMQGATGSTSGGAQAGRIAYDSSGGKFKFCNGSSCYLMEAVASSFNEVNTPFGGLGLTDVNSLSDASFTGGTITSSRVSPYQAKTLTLSGNITYAASAAVFIRAKTIIFNSATVHANGVNAGNAAGACSAGGRGGSGGGAAVRTGGSGTSGGTNGCAGGIGTGTTYNTGFSYGNGGAGGAGGQYVADGNDCGYYSSPGGTAGAAGNAYGGGGGGGGASYGAGGGGSGGLVVIVAESISGTVTIQSRGGNGGAGYVHDNLCNGWPDGYQSSGGGGGGGGGVIWVAAKSKTGTYTVTASGGTGGTSSVGGAGGTTGSAGTIRLFQINADGSLTSRVWTDTW